MRDVDAGSDRRVSKGVKRHEKRSLVARNATAKVRRTDLELRYSIQVCSAQPGTTLAPHSSVVFFVGTSSCKKLLVVLLYTRTGLYCAERTMFGLRPVS